MTRPPAGGPTRSRNAMRSGGLALALTVVFLTVGLPRRLAGDVDPAPGHARVDFAKLCREHRGTPRPAPGSGREAQLCTVHYGQHVYLMDAITARGFDGETARFQRQGCEEEARLAPQGSAAARQRGQSFIYHPETGVCEHRH
jgi:hypothetical protein